MTERLTEREGQAEDSGEETIRPADLREFIGQETLKETLSIAIGAAHKRKKPIDHILFSGPPGLGKTTLAHIISHEMGTSIHSTSGPVLEKPGDLAAILTTLKSGDVLFIDEIHRLRHGCRGSPVPCNGGFFGRHYDRRRTGSEVNPA